MPSAIVIPAELQQPLRLEHFEKNDLDAYRHLVGGNIEVVRLERPPASLYFNEEGKLLELPINRRATVLLWAHNSAFRGRDIIVGDAFILGWPDQRGDDTAAPQELVDLLLYTERYRVLVQTEGDEKFYGNLRTFDSWYDAYLYGVELVERWGQIEEILVVPEPGNEQDKLIEQWLRIGQENPWIKTADDPPFTRSSFYGCVSTEELKERIGHGNWSLGTAFFYRDLCFIQQVDGGDEWLTIRHGIAFESITFGLIIERGEFASLITRLLTATMEQCRGLEY